MKEKAIIIVLCLILAPIVGNTLIQGLRWGSEPREKRCSGFRLFKDSPVTQLGEPRPENIEHQEITGVTWEPLFRRILPRGWHVNALEGGYIHMPVYLEAEGPLPDVLEKIGDALSVRFVLDWKSNNIYAAPFDMYRKQELEAAISWLDGKRIEVHRSINDHVWPTRGGLWRAIHQVRAKDELDEYIGLVRREKELVEEIETKRKALKMVTDNLNCQMRFSYVAMRIAAENGSRHKYVANPATGRIIETKGEGENNG